MISWGFPSVVEVEAEPAAVAGHSECLLEVQRQKILHSTVCHPEKNNQVTFPSGKLLPSQEHGCATAIYIHLKIVLKTEYTQETAAVSPLGT